jgi:hypothetical protein
MTLQQSVALRNAMIGQYEPTVGTAPKVQFRSGLPPADCATASSGTLGCEVNLPTDWMAAPSAGAVAKNGTWSATASAAILAQHFRLVDTAGTTCHEQGLVCEVWAASKAYIVNQQVSNGGNVYRATAAGTSAGSGGPSGTGGSITDGGVTWAFVQVGAEMTVDNTVLNSGQTVTVSSWSRTQGGA